MSDVQGRTPDERLGRVLADLTDASPSPALAANVMRAIADGRAVRSPRQASDFRPRRLALASAAVVLVAVSAWLAIRSVQLTGPTVARTDSRDVTLPASGARPTEGPAVQADASGPATLTPGVGPGTNRAARPRSHGSHARVVHVIAALQHKTIEQMVVVPLAPPAPIEVAPLVVEPVLVERAETIAPLRVRPIEPDNGMNEARDRDR